MSTHILSACWALSGMSSTQKLVLISLADQANDDGVCWPSVPTACGSSGLFCRWRGCFSSGDYSRMNKCDMSLLPGACATGVFFG